MPRRLSADQTCEVWTHDAITGESRLVFATRDLLLEAPNWAGDALILNGDGRLWRLPLAAPELQEIPLQGVVDLNNDHVLDPDGRHIWLSANDWHIYRAPLAGGRADRVTGDSGLMHFLHGVSATHLAFVGVTARVTPNEWTLLSAEICTMRHDGSELRQLTRNGPADGPEYGPDGWLYYNTEGFSGHAQIARMRPDGTGAERLSRAATVDWFPHLSPDGRRAVYLSYPPGTRGHPADLPVTLNLVEGDWQRPRATVQLFGGQGTINVNSWSPDSRRFAFVAYPRATG